MKTGVFPEYLGDIDTEALLQNIKNENPAVSSIAWLRESVPDGFTVSAEFERPYAETEADKQQFLKETMERLQREPNNFQPPPAKLVRIVIEPK